MIIPEKCFPFFTNELHRHQQYQILSEKVQNWDVTKISQENKRSNLLSLFQYRMFSDPGLYQHVLEEIQNDETVLQSTIRYMKYLWYSWTVDPGSFCQESLEINKELEKRFEGICKELCPVVDTQLSGYLYKYPMHSILDSTFILEIRNLLKNENKDTWELVFLQLTRNRSSYSNFGNIAYFATKGKKDPKLWKKLELEWLTYFCNQINYEKNIYPKYSDYVDNEEVLASNEEFEQNDRIFLSFNSNREPEAKIFFSNTDYCQDLRKRFAKEFNIDYKPYWKFNPPKLEDYPSSEGCNYEEFLESFKEESRPYTIFQKFTTDCITIAAEFWFLSKTESEMCSLLNQEWKFLIKHMLTPFDNFPLSEISNFGISYLEYGCVDEAITILEYYLSRAKTPEEQYHGHMNLAECHRLLKHYNVAHYHYSQAKEIVAPFLKTKNWNGLNKEFQSPEAYGRLAEIHIREMNYFLKKGKFQINPKKFLKKSSIKFSEKDALVNSILEIYIRLGLSNEGFKLEREWNHYSWNDHIKEYNRSKEDAENICRKQNELEKLEKLVKNNVEDDAKDSIWEERDKERKQYQDFTKICEKAFQNSLNLKYCKKLFDLQKFYPEDVTLNRQLKQNQDVVTISQLEQDFYLQCIYEYAVSLYKIGNYELCSNLVKEYLRFCKGIHYWDAESNITDEELNQDFEQLLNPKSVNKKIDSNIDPFTELMRIKNSPFKKFTEYRKSCENLGLWGISAYYGCSLIMSGKFDEGMQLFFDELTRLSKLDHDWELSVRFSHFIDIVIEKAIAFDSEIRNELFDTLENYVIEHFPGYQGVRLISETYLSNYWLQEAERWFKGKKHDRTIADLSLDDQGRMYQIKGRFYLKRGSMGAEKMLHKAEESPIMSQPGKEMMSLQLDLANLALLKKDFSEMKKCYLKIRDSGYEPDNPHFKEILENIENYLNRHLTLEKLSSPKLLEVVNYFEKAELESIQFYNLDDSISSQDKKLDCSLPLSHYAWGLDKYLYLVLWTKVRDYVFSKNIEKSAYSDLKYSDEKSLSSWYPPFERNYKGCSTESSPTLGNWMHLSKLLDMNAPNQVIQHMSDFLQKYDSKLLENIVEIAKILHPYRNDICHAKPVYMTSVKFQEERFKIVSLLNNLFDNMNNVKF